MIDASTTQGDIAAEYAFAAALKVERAHADDKVSFPRGRVVHLEATRSSLMEHIHLENSVLFPRALKV